MPERQSQHPDNEMIDRMTDEKTPSQGSSSGGEVNTRVGSRAELNRATDPDNREPVTGSDNPQEDALKGEKTIQKLQEDRNDA